MKFRALLLWSVTLAISVFMLACGGGGDPPGGGSQPPGLRVDITPQTVQVAFGGTFQFTAVVQNATVPGVTWTVPGGISHGIISSTTGLYQAPAAVPATPPIKVRATSNQDSTIFAEATVSLYIAPVPGTFPIDLTVGTRTLWTSTSVPVTSGVPMSKGLCPNENTLRVQTAAGVDVPAQFRVLSRWSDNSVRWVLVDFMANTATGGGAYRLNNGGSGSATGTALNVNNSASSITVNTGVLSFTVSKTAFRLFESVLIDRDGGGTINDECLNTAALRGIVVSDNSTDYLMNQIAPDSITVEEQGPLRVCLRVEGRHRSAPAGADKLRYVVRIHAWNNLPYIKVVYSFKNMQNHGLTNAGAASEAAQLASHTDADSVSMELPLALGGAPTAMFVGDSTTHQGSLTATQSATLLQNYSGTYDPTDGENLPQPGAYVPGTGDGSGDTLTNAWPTSNDTQISYSVLGGIITGAGAKAPGAMQMAFSASPNNLRVTAAVRDFWQQYPKALHAQADGLMRLDFWPAGTWKMQAFEGVMKTHEVMLSFERLTGVLGGAATQLANLINDAPFAACTPTHYRASQAFGHIGITNSTFTAVNRFQPAYQSYITPYLTEVQRHFTDILGDRASGNGTAAGHEYGFWNYGDGKNEDGNGSWDNQDFGVARACFVWFAASGYREMLGFGDAALRHYRDINVIHSDVGRRFNYSEAGNPAVGNYGGNSQTTQIGKSRFTPNNKQHDLGNYHFGSHNIESLKGEMLGDHYLLFGDGLSLEVLQEAYLFTRGTLKRHLDAASGGQDNTFICPTNWLSNGLFTAVSYFLCTGSADAQNLVNYLVSRIRARQSAVEPNDPNGVGFPDTSGNFRAWLVGHLTEALEYHRWVMEDVSVDSNLATAMAWLLGTNAGVYLGNPPANIPGAFAELPFGTTDFGSVNLLLGAGYTGALRATNDPQWRVRASNLIVRQTTDLQAQTDSAIRHKTFAQRFRAGPAMLAVFE